MGKKLFKYKLKNAEFVAGEDELCFQSIIEDFPKAQYINIITYNISSKSDYLLSEIIKAGTRDIPINIITNIPNRWPQYWGDSFKATAKKSINLYQKRLDPKSFGKLASVFFKFNNHGKIVMTNNIIYWGSSNYSDESKKNFECGTICTDKEFIKYVADNVVKEIIQNSTSYYSDEYNNCLLILFSALSIIHNKHEEIFEASYDYDNDYGTNFETIAFFNNIDNHLTWNMLESFLSTIDDLESVLLELQDDLSESKENYSVELDNIVTTYQAIIVIKNSEIKRLCNEIKPLASFSEEDYVSDLLQDEYYLEAYDENLDYYAQLAFNRGRDEKNSLIEGSKDYIKDLIKSLDEYESEIYNLVDKVMNIAIINRVIDNTL